MENGVGAVHGPKDSGGSEIFEEAVESALDNENDGLILDSDDVGVRSIAIGESDADFAAAEGSPRPLDEVEKTEIAVEGSSEERDDNGASVEKTEIPVEGSTEGRDDNGVSSVEKTEIAMEGSSERRDDNGESSVEKTEIALEGSSERKDDNGESSVEKTEIALEGSSERKDDNGESSVEKTEIALEGSSEGRDVNGESVETRDESSVGNSGEGSVTIENNDGGLTNEELSNVDERVLSQDVAVTKESSSEESEASPLNIKEIEAIEGDEDTVEKSVVLEISESKDVGTIGQDGAHANLAEDVKDVITNGDVEHVNEETVRELKDALADKSSESQKEKPEEIKETLSENLIHEDSEAVLSRVSPDIKESVEVVPEKVLGETDSQIHDCNKDSDTRVLAPEHHNEGPKAEGRSSDDSSIASSLQDAKTKSVASDLGASTNGTIQMQSPDTVARDSQALAAGAASEKTKTEDRQNSQAKETTVKPVETSAAASEKSANSVLPAHPAGLGHAAPLLEPAPRAVHQPRANGQVSQAQTHIVDDTTNGEVEEGDEIREKLQMIRVKFLRLAHRLGQTPHNVVVAQVLYRLGLAEQLRARTGGRVGAFSFDRASAMAEQLEAAGQEPLDFTCTIMVLGKAGVGKSATINSIFDEVKFGTDAFQMGTTKVQDVVGTVQGIKVRVIDTPGLLSSCSDQHKNEKILHSVKRFIKKSPPDIVLYLDRLDMPSRDFGDMPLLRTITDIFGPSIWFNAIVVLTHAASAPPEGPNGTPSTYDMFVTQRSHAVQQVIRQAAGDMRLMNPVALVENHSACRTNRAGQRVLPNGQVWKPHLLLLSFASKILAEANILLKLQDTPPGKPFTTRSRAPPLPYLLSTLLQSRPQLKLPEEQFGDDDAMDDDLCESSESDEESEYDELPPFKPLTKAQLDKLPKAQKKAYYDELEYREKLFMKKQLKEDRRRRKMMKKMAAAAKDMPSEYSENVEEESGAAASLPVPMPDLALPASFDSDNPTHRYRYLDTSNQWLVRPVLDNHGWDHDVGYEGINLERMFVVKDKVPLSFSGQVSKDKKEANLQMEVASSIKHGEGKATTLGFDMQSAGKDLVYTLRSETRFCNYMRNKATAGLSATLMGDVVSAGVKLEDKLIINKQLRMVLSGGAMAGRGDVAYGGSLEATFRDKDYPVGRFLSTLGLSVMDWHGELALGCNINTQIPLGRSTNLIARANLNNRGSGQVSLRLNSAEQLQLALIGFLPLLRKLMGQGQDHPLGY